MVKANEEVLKAKQAVKSAKHGKSGRTKKIRLTPHFRRPKTLEYQRKKNVLQKLCKKEDKMDDYRIIKGTLSTEAAVRLIEHNTLTFICDVNATKPQIRAAVLNRFGCKPIKVNTLIRPDGQKKAFVRLGGHQDVSDLATRLGII